MNRSGLLRFLCRRATTATMRMKPPTPAAPPPLRLSSHRGCAKIRPPLVRLRTLTRDHSRASRRFGHQSQTVSALKALCRWIPAELILADGLKMSSLDLAGAYAIPECD